LLRIITLLLLPFSALSQKSTFLELSGGIGSGWWTYDKGIADDGNHLGWDNSPVRAFAGVEAECVFRFNRWNVGLGSRLAFYLYDKMLAGNHSQYHQNKYKIAERNVRFIQFYVVGEYDLFSGKKFLFSPFIKAGSFLIDTTHPQADKFGFRMMFSGGVNNQFVLTDRLWLVAGPYCQVMTIWGNEKARDGEKHQIFNLNFDLGLRYVIH